MTTVEEASAIEHESTTLPIGDLVRYLADHLGRQAVAYMVGLKDAQMLPDWMSGQTDPRSVNKMRIRHAYRAARIIIESFDDKTAEAWLFGSNSQLDEDAPAAVLRNARTVEDLRYLIPAAKAFARAPE
jgi:hypothetical protein